MTVQPLYKTEVDPSLPNRADAIIAEAQAQGIDFMPWQIEASRIVGAQDEAGNPAFPICVISGPRQIGKTTWLKPVVAERSKGGNGLRSYITSQTRPDARRFIEELGLTLADEGVVRLSNGDERFTWTRTGSTIEVVAPKPHGFHGRTTTGIAILDEVWSLSELVLSGALPTLVASPGGQVIFTSTMGTADSHAWNALVDQGIESLDDPNSEIGFLFYGAKDDADVLEGNFEKFHPAFGFTQTAKSLNLFMGPLTPSEKIRAMGNRLTATASALFPEAWVKQAFEATLPLPEKMVLGVDVSASPPGATVSYAFVEDGVAKGGTYRWKYGAPHWVADQVAQLIREFKIEAVVADWANQPSEAIHEALRIVCEKRRIPLVEPTSRQVGSYNYAFYEGLRPHDCESAHEGEEIESCDLHGLQSVVLRRTPEMETAIRSSESRASGEYWYISRKKSKTDQSPVVATILAMGVAKELSLRPKNPPLLIGNSGS